MQHAESQETVVGSAQRVVEAGASAPRDGTDGGTNNYYCNKGNLKES